MIRRMALELENLNSYFTEQNSQQKYFYESTTTVTNDVKSLKNSKNHNKSMA